MQTSPSVGRAGDSLLLQCAVVDPASGAISASAELEVPTAEFTTGSEDLLGGYQHLDRLQERLRQECRLAGPQQPDTRLIPRRISDRVALAPVTSRQERQQEQHGSGSSRGPGRAGNEGTSAGEPNPLRDTRLPGGGPRPPDYPLPVGGRDVVPPGFRPPGLGPLPGPSVFDPLQGGGMHVGPG